MQKKIRVLVVDDSAVVRKTLVQSLESETDIEVVGTAPEPYSARDLLVKLRPDVITLDIEMPKMDGLTFLRKIMKYVPTPVIIISSLTRTSSELAIQAFEYGAVEVMQKPESSLSLGNLSRELAHKIRAAAIINSAFLKEKYGNRQNQDVSTTISLSNVDSSSKLLVVGASTGGTRAIEELLKPLPLNMAPIVIVQHMPPVFTTSFAQTLNRYTCLSVKEAENDEIARSGTVYIAPGGFHLLVARRGSQYQLQLRSGPQIHYQKPAVDVLFKSAAKQAGKNCLGVLLTGMGCDGAEGLLAMRQAGAHTIAQDESTSIIYGMPKAAVQLQAAIQELPLPGIPAAMVNWLEKRS